MSLKELGELPIDVCIPRARYEALMAAAKVLVRAQHIINSDDEWAEGATDKACQEALAALRAAGILDETVLPAP